MQTRMGWVVRMSLPDATRSDRIYPLLQNLDLENLAFATLQGTGETLNIEEMNEDELRRLVLVNLARLTVKGEWNGLLSSGSSGASFVLPNDDSGTNNRFIISQGPVWGSADVAATANLSIASKPMAFPFIAPKSGNVSEIGINITTGSAANVYVAIYSSDSNGMADSRLGYATIDTTSTGSIYQTSITGTITLVAGTQYWYAVCIDQGSRSPYAMSVTADYVPGMGLGAQITQDAVSWFDNSAVAYAIPAASFTNSYTYSSGMPRVCCSLKIA